MKDEVKNLAQAILDKGHLISLATVDENGPWVSDLVYVVDDQWNIFWLSQIDARHSRAILKNSAVAGTITISNKSKEPNECLQIAGIAHKVEGDVFSMAIKHRLKRSYPAPQKEGEILDPGESWYRFTPTKIQLIYEPLFGFNKQEVL